MDLVYPESPAFMPVLWLLQGRMLKRRQAFKRMICHMTADGPLNRNSLKGALADAMHAVLCGAGHNLRMMLAHLRVLLYALVGQLALAMMFDIPTQFATKAPARD